jgi:hypothetical protein
MRLLIEAADHGGIMMARIGVMRGLNHDKPVPAVERRKAVKRADQVGYLLPHLSPDRPCSV